MLLRICLFSRHLYALLLYITASGFLWTVWFVRDGRPAFMMRLVVPFMVSFVQRFSIAFVLPFVWDAVPLLPLDRFAVGADISLVVLSARVAYTVPSVDLFFCFWRLLCARGRACLFTGMHAAAGAAPGFGASQHCRRRRFRAALRYQHLSGVSGDMVCRQNGDWSVRSSLCAACFSKSTTVLYSCLPYYYRYLPSTFTLYLRCSTITTGFYTYASAPSRDCACVV